MIAQSPTGAIYRIAPSGKHSPRLRPGQPLLLNLYPFAGVCFTMRTYKVKPTER